MSKFLKVFFLFLSLGFFAQDGIKFENDTFQNILNKAKKDNKLIFLDAFASWCGPCKLLERNVFPQKEVGEFYNKNFINSRFDMEKGEGRDIARKYGINSYPSLLFINGNGEVVFKGMGYMDVSDFLGMGKDVLNPDNKIEKRIEKFHAGEKDLEFLLKLMKDVAKNDFAFGQKVSERYFQVKENSEFTKDDAGILLYFTKSSDDDNFKTFVKRKADLLKFIPENTLNDFEKQLRLTTIIQKSVDYTNAKINDNYLVTEATKVIGDKDAKILSSRLRKDFYFNNKNFPEYEKASIDYYQNPADFSAEELNQISWDFYLYVSNPDSLKKAVEWSLESTKKYEDNINTDTLARLYYKLNDKKNAKIWAEKSIDWAKKNNAEYTSTEDLLKNLK